MMKKICGPIKKNKDDLGNFEIHKKLIRHIFPPLKPYNFCMEQFFIRCMI